MSASGTCCKFTCAAAIFFFFDDIKTQLLWGSNVGYLLFSTKSGSQSHPALWSGQLPVLNVFSVRLAIAWLLSTV